MVQIEIHEFELDPARALVLAAKQEVLLTQDGEPRFQLMAVDADDDAWEESLLQDPRFIAKLERGRQQIREGDTVALEEIDFDNP